jgi:hypothetical protein
MRVGGVLATGSGLPKDWLYFVSVLMQDTSYSDFQREINNLRKAQLLEGEIGATNFLKMLLERQCPDDRAQRKQLALLLVTKGKASQRMASKITGVSRDTLRSALSAGAK